MASNAKPNIVLFGIDSLRADHMSCYGYEHLTSPYLDRFAGQGVLFENTISAHIPTTSAYASMLTGMDVFSTQVVALRHQGGLRPEVKTLAEILRDEGYHTICVGFDGNPSSRGFDEYLSYKAWGSWEEGRLPKAQLLNEQAIPAIDRMVADDKPYFIFLRHMDPHAPYLPPEPYERMFYHGDECDPSDKSMEPVLAFKPFRDFLASWLPPASPTKTMSSPNMTARSPIWTPPSSRSSRPWRSMAFSTKPSWRSTATTAKRSTTMNAGSITTASMTMCCTCP